MSKVRIGFVGVGTMGQMAHLRNYAVLEDCEVVALADPRAETVARVAERYGVPTTYSDHHALLDAEELDGVVAVLPFNRHAAVLPDLYGRVPCLFTEKPLAVGVEAGRRLARAAEEAGCVHMVGYHKRSDPATERAIEVLSRWRSTGEVGALRYVRITMPPGEWVQGGFTGLIDEGETKPSDATEPPPDDMPEEQAQDYVAFVNYYIHQVNLLRHLMGEPYRVTHADESGVLLVAEGESGTAGVIEMAPYRTSRTWEESALVAFERGYVHLELPAPMALNRAGSVEVYQDPEDEEPQRLRPVLPPVHAMRRQAENFVTVCRGDKDPPCAPEEAVEDLVVARDYIRMRFGTQTD
ncbi:MAG: Gfo/Idh/MocA family oxidoreductase [Candidatus Brocadiia bacterium]